MCALPNALRQIAGVVTASRLERPPAAMVSSGIAEVDALTGGFPRGGLTEIYGAPSSGRTGLVIAALAAATARDELCALIDVSDCFDPRSAQAAGVNLEKLLWVRCGDHGSKRSGTDPGESRPGNLVDVKRVLQAKQDIGTIMPAAKVWYGRAPARSERQQSGKWLVAGVEQNTADDSPLATRHFSPELHGGEKRRSALHWTPRVEQALKAADLILQGGGFGMVVLDMGDVPSEIARRIPLTSWFRFSRAVENTPAVLLAIELEACAKTCASLVLKTAVSAQRPALGESNAPSHARVFSGITSNVEVVRSRVETPTEVSGKKPPRGVRTEFASRTEWAG